MKPNAYAILARAVEEGLEWGWVRAHKHTDNPTRQQIIEAMDNAVMLQICEVFDFEEELNSDD